AKGRAGLRGAEHFVEALLEQPERACHGGIGRGRGGGYSAKGRREVLIDSILRPLQSSGRILPLDHVGTLHVIAQTLDHDPDVRSALYQRITQRDAIAQLQRLSEYAPQRGKDRGGGPHDGGHRRPRDYCSERGYAAKSLVHLGQNVFCRLPRRDIGQGLVVRFQSNHRLASRSQGVYRSDDRATAIAVERGWPERYRKLEIGGSTFQDRRGGVSIDQRSSGLGFVIGIGIGLQLSGRHTGATAEQEQYQADHMDVLPARWTKDPVVAAAPGISKDRHTRSQGAFVRRVSSAAYARSSRRQIGQRACLPEERNEPVPDCLLIFSISRQVPG